MRYVLLCYLTAPGRGPAVSKQEWDALAPAGRARPVGDHLLEPPSEAMSVRPVDGEVFAIAGPFMETREWLAGFFLVECADLDEAVETARRCGLTGRFPCVEVRPVHDGSRVLADHVPDWS